MTITARGAIPGLLNLVDFFGKLLFWVFPFVFDKIFHMGRISIISSPYWEFSNFLVKFGELVGSFGKKIGNFYEKPRKKSGKI